MCDNRPSKVVLYTIGLTVASTHHYPKQRSRPSQAALAKTGRRETHGDTGTGIACSARDLAAKMPVPAPTRANLSPEQPGCSWQGKRLLSVVERASDKLPERRPQEQDVCSRIVSGITKRVPPCGARCRAHALPWYVMPNTRWMSTHGV